MLFYPHHFLQAHYPAWQRSLATTAAPGKGASINRRPAVLRCARFHIDVCLHDNKKAAMQIIKVETSPSCRPTGNQCMQEYWSISNTAARSELRCQLIVRWAKTHRKTVCFDPIKRRRKNIRFCNHNWNVCWVECFACFWIAYIKLQRRHLAQEVEWSVGNQKVASSIPGSS